MRDVSVAYTAVMLVCCISVCLMFIWCSLFWRKEEQPGDDVPLLSDPTAREVLAGIERAQGSAIRGAKWDQRSIEDLMERRHLAWLDRHDIPRYMLLQPTRGIENIMRAVGLLPISDCLLTPHHEAIPQRPSQFRRA